MSPPLRYPVLALLLAGAAGCALAQGGAGIYTCIDAQGRRLTSDRPIRECLDREQRELNASGTVRRTVGPSLTAAERAVQEERDRKAAEERQRQAEEKRLQRALLMRYPNQAVHEGERAKALQSIHDNIAGSERRIADLQQQRAKVAAEAEFHKHRKPADWPIALKRQLEDNEQQVAAQQRFIASQREEQRRVAARFDEELTRLKVLWAQAQGTTAAAAADTGPVKR